MHSELIASRHSIETIVQNVHFPIEPLSVLTRPVSDGLWQSLPSDLPRSPHCSPKLKTGEVQVTLAPGSTLEVQGWVLTLPITASQILHSHIHPPPPNNDK